MTNDWDKYLQASPDSISGPQSKGSLPGCQPIDENSVDANVARMAASLEQHIDPKTKPAILIITNGYQFWVAPDWWTPPDSTPLLSFAELGILEALHVDKPLPEKITRGLHMVKKHLGGIVMDWRWLDAQQPQ